MKDMNSELIDGFWSWLMVSDVESPIQPWNFVGSTSILRELILRFPCYTLLQLACNEMGVAWAEKKDPPPPCQDDYTPPTRSWDITPLNEETSLGHLPLVSSCFGPTMSVHRKSRWWKCMKIRTSLKCPHSDEPISYQFIEMLAPFRLR